MPHDVLVENRVALVNDFCDVMGERVVCFSCERDR